MISFFRWWREEPGNTHAARDVGRDGFLSGVCGDHQPFSHVLCWVLMSSSASDILSTVIGGSCQCFYGESLDFCFNTFSPVLVFSS